VKEALENAFTELKRVDHLFYVSLKYTRTADMMKHVMERMINSFSYCIESLLKHAQEAKKIQSIPENHALRCKLLLEISDDPEIKSFISFYLKLRKINRAEYTKREEFRRHVTMTVTIDNGEVIEVNIDVLKEYYDRTRDFVDYVRKIVHGEEEP